MKYFKFLKNLQNYNVYFVINKKINIKKNINSFFLFMYFIIVLKSYCYKLIKGLQNNYINGLFIYKGTSFSFKSIIHRLLTYFYFIIVIFILLLGLFFFRFYFNEFVIFQCFFYWLIILFLFNDFNIYKLSPLSIINKLYVFFLFLILCLFLYLFKFYVEEMYTFFEVYFHHEKTKAVGLFTKILYREEI